MKRIHYAVIGYSVLLTAFFAVNIQQLFTLLSLWSYPFARAAIVLPLVGFVIGGGGVLLGFRLFKDAIVK